MRKAQTEAITLVLISGIIISLVGFAWTWGKPMIDKRSVMTQFASATRFMEDLDEKIVNMAGTCSSQGSCEETITLPFAGLVTLDEANNAITYTFDVNQPLITKGEVIFNTVDNGTVARYGEKPSVISLRGKTTPSSLYTLIFTLRYRELDSTEPWKGYKIQLTSLSGNVNGNNRIIISYGGSETRAGQAHNGGDLVVSKVKVQPI
jgi:hypothetical protein